jgi:hypothetical protein
LNGEKYRHRRTLIVGEVRSGKTACTLRVFRSLRKTCRGPFCVLDLAPEEVNGVGGKLPLSEEEKGGVIYLSPLIVPPRLRGKSEEEVQRLAGENRERIDQILRTPKASGVNVLFVNDISLYFHAGRAEQLWLQVEGIPTLILNGYYGRYFGDSSLSRRERSEMEFLMARCDRVLYFPPYSLPDSSPV